MANMIVKKNKTNSVLFEKAARFAEIKKQIEDLEAIQNALKNEFLSTMDKKDVSGLVFEGIGSFVKVEGSERASYDIKTMLAENPKLANTVVNYTKVSRSKSYVKFQNFSA